MRALIATLAAAGLGTALAAACAPVSDRIDGLTGTTLADRCAYRAAALEAYDLAHAIGVAPDITAGTAELYRSYVGAVCPQR